MHRTDADARGPASRAVRALLATSVALLALLSPHLLAPAGAAPISPDPATAATYGATWLAARAAESTPLKGFDGTSDDWGLTLDAGLALASSGVGGNAAESIWTAFAANREAAVVAGGDNPGRLGRALLLAVALGKDPRSVGSAPGNDLVARLQATRTTSGTDVGLFGSTDPTFDGVYRQAYALMGLAAAGATPDPTAVAWLESQQCADGAWTAYRADTGAACVSNPAAFTGQDSNSTAAAVEALVALGVAAPRVTSAVGWLDGQQNADGGWGFYPTNPTDPNSTGLVVQALVAAGKLADPVFADKAATPQAVVLSFQLTCAEPAADRGALTYPGSSNAANSFATVQGVPALAGRAFPLPAVTLTAAVPAVPCEAPTTTTTTTTTSTTTTSTTAAPTTSSSAVPTTAATAAVLAEQDVATPTGTLASTGTGSRPLALLGGLLLASGLALALVARRR